jgi:hypothetical protein
MRGLEYPPPAFLWSPARTLMEACREAGRDNGGRRCPDCPVRDLCKDESRWLVRRTAARRMILQS